MATGSPRPAPMPAGVSFFRGIPGRSSHSGGCSVFRLLCRLCSEPFQPYVVKRPGCFRAVSICRCFLPELPADGEPMPGGPPTLLAASRSVRALFQPYVVKRPGCFRAVSICRCFLPELPADGKPMPGGPPTLLAASRSVRALSAVRRQGAGLFSGGLPLPIFSPPEKRGRTPRGASFFMVLPASGTARKQLRRFALHYLR